MNDYLYRFLRPILTGWFKLFYRPNIKGIENIPSSGRIVLAGTHTNVLDPILILSCCRRTIHFLAKDELVNGRFGFIFKRMAIIPVNRREKDNYVMGASINVLKNDEVIGIFPEGTINRTDEPTIKFKTGAVRMAYETDSMIVPFAITGKYRLFGKRVSIRFGKAYCVESKDANKETIILQEKINKMVMEER